MSKDITKLKEEMKAEFTKLKDELKQEQKAFREMLERDLRNEIRDLKNEQTSMCKSLEFAHAEIADLKTRLNVETANNARLEAENRALREQCSDVENKARDLDVRLVQTEQYSRNVNIEIQGVIEKENESVVDIMSKLGEAISEPVAESDIEICHRVPTRNANKTNIIVQFKSRAKRDTVLKKAKKMRLTNEDIALDSSEPTYVNEHLCPALKKLLGMAIKKKHEHNWKSAWSFKGRIFAKRTDDSPIVPIKNENDLAKICPQRMSDVVS